MTTAKENIYLSNRGIGDNSWLDKHEKLQATLKPYLQTPFCTLQAHHCGFPCGGYLYTVSVSVSHAEEIKAKLAEIGFHNSVSDYESINLK